MSASEAVTPRNRVLAEKAVRDVFAGRHTYEALVDHLTNLIYPLIDFAENAWTIICNAGHGDWSKESADWQEAAAKCRDAYCNLWIIAPGSVWAAISPQGTPAPPVALEQKREAVRDRRKQREKPACPHLRKGLVVTGDRRTNGLIRVCLDCYERLPDCTHPKTTIHGSSNGNYEICDDCCMVLSVNSYGKETPGAVAKPPCLHSHVHIIHEAPMMITLQCPMCGKKVHFNRTEAFNILLAKDAASSMIDGSNPADLNAPSASECKPAS